MPTTAYIVTRRHIPSAPPRSLDVIIWNAKPPHPTDRDTSTFTLANGSEWVFEVKDPATIVFLHVSMHRDEAKNKVNGDERKMKATVDWESSFRGEWKEGDTKRVVKHENDGKGWVWDVVEVALEHGAVVKNPVGE